MKPSRSQDRDTFSDLVAACKDAFSYLASEYGYRASREIATERGFAVDYQGEQIGVRVTYQVGDPLSVDVCLLDHSEFPKPLGEIRPDSRIAQFDLVDIEAVAGIQHSDAVAEAFAIPRPEMLGKYADRLHVAAVGLLAGDTEMVPALRERVLSRAAAAARLKWGAKASEFGW